MSAFKKSKPDIRLIIILGILAACGPLATDMYLPSMPAIAKSFFVPDSIVALTLSTFLAGFGVGMLLYGPTSDIFGRRPILIGGIVIFVASTLGCVFASTVDWLIICRFFQALGAGAAYVLVRAVARDAHLPHDAAKVLSMVSMVSSLGPLIAPLVGGQVLRFTSWRGIFVVLLLYGLVCFVVSIAHIPETWPKEMRKHSMLSKAFSAYGHILIKPISWGYLLCGGMTFASMFAYITATPFIYINYYHVAAQNYGLLFAVNVIGLILGNILNAKFVGSLGTIRMIRYAYSVGCLASLSVAFVCLSGIGGLIGLMCALFFMVSVVGVLSANCITELMHIFPQNAGAAAALFGTSQFGFGGLAALLIGLLQDETPRALGITVLILLFFSITGFTLIMRLHKQQALSHEAKNY